MGEDRCDERLKTKEEESTFLGCTGLVVVYYESIKRELKIRCVYECRCDERLQSKTKEFTLLVHTGFGRGTTEHLKNNVCLLLIDKARTKDKTYI
jgi:hypothetical protein